MIVPLLERSLTVPEDTSLRLVPEVGILKAALNVNIFNMIIGTIIIVFFPPPSIFPAWKGLHIFTRSCESKILFNIICLLLDTAQL